jgi:hypothetical protein
MNIQSGDIAKNIDLKQNSHNDFHIARSIFLDAFSELEIAVAALLATCSSFKEGEKKPFGQRVESLKTLLPNSKLSKEKCAKIHDKAAHILPIHIIRCDIVHGQLDVVNIDGLMHAKICNNNTVTHDPTMVRLLNMECFKLLARESKKIANELKQILNQPTSKPQATPPVKASP